MARAAGSVLWVALLSAGVGCTTRPADTEAGTGGAAGDTGAGDDGGPGTTSAAPPPGTGSGNATAGVSTQTGEDTAGGSTDGTDDWADQGCGFYAGCAPDGGTSYECDVFAHDCPEGEKCMVWANDGGNVWNASRCSPIDPQPDPPGEPCSVEGSGVSGIDTCDLGSICWDVDASTLTGVCRSMCTGTPDDPVCEDAGTTCVWVTDVLPLCVAECNPLIGSCPDGEGCFPLGETFSCLTPTATAGDQGAACAGIDDCAPGYACLDGTAVAGCGDASCCTTLCDATAPQCPPGSACQAWYEPGAAPAGEEDLGVCLAG